MPRLTPRERELVSLGAAMGSNCPSCMEHHIPVSRTAGLNDAEISEAIRLADRVRQVPARKTLEAALVLLGESPVPAVAGAAGDRAADSQAAEPGKACC